MKIDDDPAHDVPHLMFSYDHLTAEQNHDMNTWATRVVDAAPPLSVEQKAQLWELLRPIRVERARRIAAALKAGAD